MMPASNLQQTAQMPILVYSQIRGLAQPIRNLFYYLGIKFKQQTISNSRQLQAGFTTGYPKLLHDGLQLTDSIAIFRHICRVYQRSDLLGLTPQNRAIINQFLFHYSDIRGKIVKKIGEGAKLAFGKSGDGDIYQIKINVAKSIIEDQCKIVKEFIQMHMKSKGWVVGHLTIADFFFYELCFYIVNFLGSSLKNSLIYRNYQVYLSQFQNQDFFKENKQQIMSRKIFMPFKDKQTKQIMTNFWEGNKEMVA